MATNSLSENWIEIQNSDSAELSFTAELAMNGRHYICKIWNDLDEIYSDEAVLTVEEVPVSISSHPKNLSVTEGEEATFTVIALGSKLSYQWQLSTSGSVWTDIRYATSSSYTFITSLAMSGMRYRCKVTGSTSSNEIVSNAALLSVIPDISVSPPTIIRQPASQSIQDGSNITISVVADGEDLHYQWQTYYNNKWASINNATTSSYTSVADISMNGMKLRCQVSNDAGSVYSNEITVTVSAGNMITMPYITVHPRTISVTDNTLVTFTVLAEGGSLNYLWQMKSGNSWYNYPQETSNVFSLRARSALNGFQYRCKVSNPAGTVYSNIATLHVTAGMELTFYGYHSIIISGKNTYGEWAMYPTSRPHIAPAEVKTSYVDVPGADGGLDYTDLLTGEPRYGYRKGSWEFMLIPGTNWPNVYRSLVNFLHGRQHTVVLEDDPSWEYQGRLTVNSWKSEQHNSLIVIDYVLSPSPINIEDENYNTDDDDYTAAARLLRKPENADCVIKLLNGSAVMVPEVTLFPDGEIIEY